MDIVKKYFPDYQDPEETPEPSFSQKGFLEKLYAPIKPIVESPIFQRTVWRGWAPEAAQFTEEKILKPLGVQVREGDPSRSFAETLQKVLPESWTQSWPGKITDILAGTLLDLPFIPSTYVGTGLVKGAAALPLAFLGISGRGTKAIEAGNILKEALGQIKAETFRELVGDPKLAERIASGLHGVEMGSEEAGVASRLLTAKSLAEKELQGVRFAKPEEFDAARWQRMQDLYKNMPQEMEPFIARQTKQILGESAPIYLRDPYGMLKATAVPFSREALDVARPTLEKIGLMGKTHAPGEALQEALRVPEREMPVGTVVQPPRRVGIRTPEPVEPPLVAETTTVPRAQMPPSTTVGGLYPKDPALLEGVLPARVEVIKKMTDRLPMTQEMARSFEQSLPTQEAWRSLLNRRQQEIQSLVSVGRSLSMKETSLLSRQLLEHFVTAEGAAKRGAITSEQLGAIQQFVAQHFPKSTMQKYFPYIFPKTGTPLRAAEVLLSQPSVTGQIRTPHLIQFGQVPVTQEKMLIQTILSNPDQARPFVQQVTDLVPALNPQRIRANMDAMMEAASRTHALVMLKTMRGQPAVVIRVAGDPTPFLERMSHFNLQRDLKFAGKYGPPSAEEGAFDAYAGGLNLHIQLERAVKDPDQLQQIKNQLGEIYQARAVSPEAMDRAVQTFTTTMRDTIPPTLRPVDLAETEQVAGRLVGEFATATRQVASQTHYGIPTTEDLSRVFGPRPLMSLDDMLRTSVGEWSQYKFLPYYTIREYSAIAQWLRKIPGAARIEEFFNLLSQQFNMKAFVPRSVTQLFESRLAGSHHVLSLESEDWLRAQKTWLQQALVDPNHKTALERLTAYHLETTVPEGTSLYEQEALRLMRPEFHQRWRNLLVQMRTEENLWWKERWDAGLTDLYKTNYLTLRWTGKDRYAWFSWLREDAQQSLWKEEPVVAMTDRFYADRPRHIPTIQQADRFLEQHRAAFEKSLGRPAEIGVVQDPFFLHALYRYNHKRTMAIHQLAIDLADQAPHWFMRSSTYTEMMQKLDKSIASFAEGDPQRLKMEGWRAYYARNYVPAVEIRFGKEVTILPGFAGSHVNIQLKHYLEELAERENPIGKFVNPQEGIMLTLYSALRLWKNINLFLDPLIHAKNILDLYRISGAGWDKILRWYPQARREIQLRSPLYREALSAGTFAYGSAESRGMTISEILQAVDKNPVRPPLIDRLQAKLQSGLNKVWEWIDHPVRLTLYKHFRETEKLGSMEAADLVNQFMVDYSLRDMPMATKRAGYLAFTFFPWTVGMLKVATQNFPRDPQRFFRIWRILDELQYVQEGTDLMADSGRAVHVGGGMSFYPTMPSTTPYDFMKLWTTHGVSLPLAWLMHRISPYLGIPMEVAQQRPKKGIVGGLQAGLARTYEMGIQGAEGGIWGFRALGRIINTTDKVLNGEATWQEIVSMTNALAAMGYFVRDESLEKQPGALEMTKVVTWPVKALDAIFGPLLVQRSR